MVRLLLLALTGLFLAGCSQSPVIQVDPALDGYVDVEDVHQRVNSAGLLEVQVTAKNTTDKPLAMYYQFDWLDEDGRSVPSLLSRKNRITADKNRWFSINGVAPKPEVVNFRLYLDERSQ
ncbi:YcfL family protein [Marinobacteraceae bacterium S3BR75-40.1]